MPYMVSARSTGFVILGAGIVYLVVVSWVLSWWYVPAYRELGPTGSGTYGLGTTILWTTSGVVGAVVVALGAAFAAGMGKKRLLVVAVAGSAIIAWLVAWTVPTIHPLLFGVGGGLILLSFSGLSWRWARLRPSLTPRRQTAADLRMASYVFYFIAA